MIWIANGLAFYAITTSWFSMTATQAREKSTSMMPKNQKQLRQK
jgi:hypothetical protein